VAKELLQSHKPLPVKSTFWVLVVVVGSMQVAAQSTHAVVVVNDSATANPGNHYATIPIAGSLLMGSNYRRTWATPVQFPVLRISESSFTVQNMGGSKQTNSLYLNDAEKRVWVLRSVQKDVRRGIPSPFHLTPFLWYKKNLVSGAHPFAALIASELCEAAGIAAPKPVFFYVADDTALGEHSKMFAGTVCMLEQRDPTIDGSTTISTDTLLQRKANGETFMVMQKQLLRARLIDMILGDWDRHGGQWRWAAKDSAGVRYYSAIPRDRDHALYRTGGILPSFTKMTFEPYLVGFSKNSRSVKKLNRKAWTFDQTFLSELTKLEWEQEIEYIQKTLSDEVIGSAVRKLPPEIHARDGAEIEARLKSRRNSLKDPVLKYYDFLHR
jgi:hypothetical protein